MRHVAANGHLEQRGRQMGQRATKGRRHSDLAWISLGIGDEFRNGLGRKRWIDHDDNGDAYETSYRCDVSNKIEIEPVIKRGIDCVRRVGEQERVAVGGARTTASVAMLVPAPSRFSTSNDWPSRAASHSPTMCASRSIPLPAGKPTKMRTGRVG